MEGEDCSGGMVTTVEYTRSSGGMVTTGEHTQIILLSVIYPLSLRLPYVKGQGKDTSHNILYRQEACFQELCLFCEKWVGLHFGIVLVRTGFGGLCTVWIEDIKKLKCLFVSWRRRTFASKFLAIRALIR